MSMPAPAPPSIPAQPRSPARPSRQEEEALAILASGLRDAMSSLSTVAAGSNWRNARNAVALLHRYLNSPNAIAATVSLGADAAAAHLSAIAWLEQRKAELDLPAAGRY